MLKTLFVSIPLLMLSLAGCQTNRSAEDRNEQRVEEQARTEDQPRRTGEETTTTDAVAEQADKAEKRAQELREQAREAEREAQQLRQRAARDGAKAIGTGQNAANQVSNRGGGALNQTERARDASAARQNDAIPAGAVLRVRLDQPLDTSKNAAGDRFSATLEQPVALDGRTVIPKGTRFNGTITTAESSGRLQGRGVLTVQLDSFDLNGKVHNINSSTVSRITGDHKMRDIGIIGGTAGAGAAIGAIAGGGKGAAIGAGAGAVAGTAAAAATGKLDVRLPAETVMIFTLQSPVNLRG